MPSTIASPAATTLHARYAPGSIGYVIVRADGTEVEHAGAVATLSELATLVYACGAPRVTIRAILGVLPKEILTHASAHGWEVEV